MEAELLVQFVNTRVMQGYRAQNSKSMCMLCVYVNDGGKRFSSFLNTTWFEVRKWKSLNLRASTNLGVFIQPAKQQRQDKSSHQSEHSSFPKSNGTRERERTKEPNKVIHCDIISLLLLFNIQYIYICGIFPSFDCCFFFPTLVSLVV